MPTTILLTRHGQTEWNREERFRGQIDVPLNETGERQAQALARRVRHWPISAVYAGPLQRALRTAQICAEPLGLTAQVLPGLLDLNFGEWQGLSAEEVKARWPEALSLWVNAPSQLRFPGGETFGALQQRAVAAVEAVIAQHPDQTLLFAAHMVVNKVLLCAFLGLDIDRSYWLIRQDNCCLNVLRWLGPQRYEIVALNDTCHMEQLG
jgi:phosphoserine phosphatase